MKLPQFTIKIRINGLFIVIYNGISINNMIYDKIYLKNKNCHPITIEGATEK